MPDPTPSPAAGDSPQNNPAKEQADGSSIDADAGTLGGFNQADIDELLKQASFDDPGAVPPPRSSSASQAAAATGATAVADLPELGAVDLPDFQQAIRDAQVSSIDLLRDVDLNVKIELGRSRMLVEDVLKLSEGSVVELDKLAGDPVDVFVNDRLVARGEVLVLNDNFCVRINEIVAGTKDEGL
jgi:flagellar motor switch protein FliN/FliY